MGSDERGVRRPLRAAASPDNAEDRGLQDTGPGSYVGPRSTELFKGAVNTLEAAADEAAGLFVG